MDSKLFGDYWQANLDTVNPEKDDLIHHTLGVVTEAAELADIVKKNYAYDKPLDREHIQEELGDLAYYMQGVMRLQDITWEEVFAHNMEKLKKRYPGGFTNANAELRLDKKDA